MESVIIYHYPEMVANRPKIVSILGPTSTGKSDLALWLAPRIRGEIVNADSMQVYRHFDIGSAKPDKTTREAVPHHLIDVVEPDEDFNAATFQQAADKAIEGIRSRSAMPIVVGGTGLYLRVLFHGLFPVVSDPLLRERLRRQYLERPMETYEELKIRDPEYALTISHRDRVRVVRALEISYVSGVPMSEWRRRHGFREERHEVLKIGLQKQRKDLYTSINERVERMLADGWVDEVENLLEAGWSPGLKPFQSIGYREIMLFLGNELSYPEMVERIKMATRRYAKRQTTWFSRDNSIEWFEHPAGQETVLKRVKRFLN